MLRIKSIRLLRFCLTKIKLQSDSATYGRANRWSVVSVIKQQLNGTSVQLGDKLADIGSKTASSTMHVNFCDP